MLLDVGKLDCDEHGQSESELLKLFERQNNVHVYPQSISPFSYLFDGPKKLNMLSLTNDCKSLFILYKQKKASSQSVVGRCHLSSCSFFYFPKPQQADTKHEDGYGGDLYNSRLLLTHFHLEKVEQDLACLLPGKPKFLFFLTLFLFFFRSLLAI